MLKLNLSDFQVANTPSFWAMLRDVDIWPWFPWMALPLTLAFTLLWGRKGLIYSCGMLAALLLSFMLESLPVVGWRPSWGQLAVALFNEMIGATSWLICAIPGAAVGLGLRELRRRYTRGGVQS